MKLREYQAELVSGMRKSAMSGKRRPLMQLPTGGGKSVILGEIVSRAIQLGRTVVLVAHRVELIEQLQGTLAKFGVDSDPIVAGKPTPDAPCRVAMVQTLSRRVGDMEAPDILLIDEAHHAAATTYLKIIEAWQESLVIGVTATPQRLDGKGLDVVFDDLICGPTVPELIDMGNLADYRYMCPPVNPELAAELAGMKKVAGDFAKGELGKAMSQKVIVGDSVEHYRKYLDGDQAIAFCVTVDHAEIVATAFNDAGIPASSIDGKMGSEQRAGIMARFRSGKIKVLTSCELVSEGFDVPNVKGAILLRPTQSLTVYLQQVGRALRPKDDGGLAVIIDHVDNVRRHGPPDAIRHWKLEGKAETEPGTRQCKECYAILTPRASYEQCPSGWREAEHCPAVSSEDIAADALEGKEIVELDGELVELERERKEAEAEERRRREPVYFDWLPGIEVKSAAGKDFALMMREAFNCYNPRTRLLEIARARGYKPGWAHYQMVKQGQR